MSPIRTVLTCCTVLLAVPAAATPFDDAYASLNGTPSAAAEASVESVAKPQVAEVVSDAAGMIDPQAKAAWLAECRRRANITGVTTKSVAASVTEPREYDYCEAYLDDYYRNYAQSTAAYSYGYQPQALPQPAQLALSQTEQPYEEIITEEYVPVRSRSIARRTPPRQAKDKRIKLYPR